MTLVNPNPPVLQKGDIIYYMFEGSDTKSFGKVTKVMKRDSSEYTEVWGWFSSNLEEVKTSTGQSGFLLLKHAFLFERLSWKQRIND